MMLLISRFQFCLLFDRAGVVGADGPTHNEHDVSFISVSLNVVIMAPSDENECRMLHTGLD